MRDRVGEQIGRSEGWSLLPPETDQDSGYAGGLDRWFRGLPAGAVISIREAVAADAAALEVFYREIRTEAGWLAPGAALHASFASDAQGERVLVAVAAEGQVIGLISMNEAESFVHHLYVHPHQRRRGVARALLGCPLHRTPRPWRLKCVRANRDALGFYMRLGWVEIGGGEGPDGAYVLLESCG
jgi:GNAT superfamily N-acetyltransferase